MESVISQALSFISKREFISVASCDLTGRPNSAPKFVLKVDNRVIFLIDYTRGRTWDNLKINPRVSLSFMDSRKLNGYVINGKTTLIDEGTHYEKLCEELLEKKIRLTTKHIIEEVRGGVAQEKFELTMSDKVVIYKIDIDEIIEVGPGGGLIRESFNP